MPSDRVTASPVMLMKMHATGNDFVMVDGVRQHFDPKPDVVRVLSDRHFGIGCDQLILAEPPVGPDHDFVYRIFNCDGSEVEMCGNGARCFALFVHHLGLTTSKTIRAKTATRIVTMFLESDEECVVDMGVPTLAMPSAQFDATAPFDTGDTGLMSTVIATELGVFQADVLSMGNPHAVVRVDERPSPVALERCGRAIELSPLFPARTNVEFMKILNPQLAYVEVWERGAGATLSCGSGACAAAVAGIARGLLMSPVQLMLPGGTLTVEWDGDPEHSVFLKGRMDLVLPYQAVEPLRLLKSYRLRNGVMDD